MRKFKSFTSLLLVTIIVSGVLFFVQAEDNIKVVVNGKQLVFQVDPVIIKDRTMVPLRAIFEALGAEVGWEGSTRTVTGTRGETVVVLQIDNSSAKVNGNDVKLEVPGTLVNDTTMVPVRFIAESLGAKVGWNGSTRTVIIDQTAEQKYQAAEQKGQETEQIEGPKTSKNIDVLYKSQRDVEFSITGSRLVDSYFIVAGLYYDFNHSEVMPYTSEREIYRNAKAYFMPYKDHQAVKAFSQFSIDTFAYSYLLNFSDLPDAVKIHESKAGKQSFDNMVELLKQFYADTKAENFFKENQKIFDDLKLYVQKEAPNSKVEELIKEAEAYTNNKNRYFTKKVAYTSNITLFKMNAPFYRIDDKDKVTFATVAPAFKSSRGSDNFDIDTIIQTAVHESLHQYLNTPVANNMMLINTLTSNLKKEDYAAKMYIDQNMPWNRLIDENFVRAVEARIFDKIFGNSTGYKKIIEPQTKVGFKNLNKAYVKLEEYEKNRDKYKTIDEFMPELIEALLKKME